MSEELPLYMVFRCRCGNKSTIGPDYLTQVGPYPKACDRCGEEWRSVTPVLAVDPAVGAGS